MLVAVVKRWPFFRNAAKPFRFAGAGGIIPALRQGCD
jgi:hypothetical protein